MKANIQAEYFIVRRSGCFKFVIPNGKRNDEFDTA